MKRLLLIYECLSIIYEGSIPPQKKYSLDIVLFFRKYRKCFIATVSRTVNEYTALPWNIKEIFHEKENIKEYLASLVLIRGI